MQNENMEISCHFLLFFGGNLMKLFLVKFKNEVLKKKEETLDTIDSIHGRSGLNRLRSRLSDREVSWKLSVGQCLSSTSPKNPSSLLKFNDVVTEFTCPWPKIKTRKKTHLSAHFHLFSLFPFAFVYSRMSI